MSYTLNDGQLYEFYVAEYYILNGKHSRIEREVIFRCLEDMAPAVRIRQLVREGKLSRAPDSNRTATGYEISEWFKRHPEHINPFGTDLRTTRSFLGPSGTKR